MKKVLVIFALVMMVAQVAHGWNDNVAITEYSYTIANTTGAPQSFVVPTTSIRPDVDKITGMSIMVHDGTKNSETWATLYDDTDTGMIGEKIGEIEGGEKRGFYQPYVPAKKIFNGVVAWQGANTDLIIYFVRK